MDINSKNIKISSGKSEIEKELQMSQDIEIVVIGSVVKIEDTDNQDGTINRCYVIKPSSVNPK
jgi:hypothetical protein